MGGQVFITGLIESYRLILPNRLSGLVCLVFLRDILPKLLEHLPLEASLEMWFQHDGAPAHFSVVLREYTNTNYGDRWIGRGGPVVWPARSPDLKHHWTFSLGPDENPSL